MSLVENMDSSKQIEAPPDFYESEAIFAFNELKPILSNLPSKEFSALEIGCGTGFLMQKIKQEFDQGKITGLEPGNIGFEIVNEYNKDLDENIIVRCGFEDFDVREKYDLIYSVNVIEHVHDWKLYIDFVKRNLKPGGVSLILCPNYSFPYESHFSLPVLINKSLTYKVFRKRIENFEKNKNATGLWDSLNFIKKNQIHDYLGRFNSEIKFYFDEGILRTMINRLDHDKEFLERQRAIALISRLIRFLNIDKIFNINLISNYSPYIKLIINKH